MESHSTEREALDSLLRKVQVPAGSPGAEPISRLEASPEALDGDSRRPRAELLRGVHLKVRAELGRTRLPLKEALQLAPGSVIDLEKLADEPVDLYVNDLLLARGEVLVVNECFCIRITEVLANGGPEEVS